MIKQTVLVSFLVLSASAMATVMTASTTKTYILSHLASVVSNSDKCDSFHKDLLGLTKNPIVLKFSKDSEKQEHTIEDLSGQLTHHTHITIQQHEKGNKLTRVGMGSFEFHHEMVDYVLSISANLDNPKHHYLYPVILSSHDGQCYYTALVEPSSNTTETFKKNIQSGAVHQKKDLVL